MRSTDKWVECPRCEDTTEFIVCYTEVGGNILPDFAICTVCGWTTRSIKSKIKRLELAVLRNIGINTTYGQKAESAIAGLRYMAYQRQMDRNFHDELEKCIQMNRSPEESLS